MSCERSSQRPDTLPGRSSRSILKVAILPSAARPLSRHLPRMAVSMLPPHNITTTLEGSKEKDLKRVHCSHILKITLPPPRISRWGIPLKSALPVNTQTHYIHKNQTRDDSCSLLSMKVVQLAREAGCQPSGSSTLHHTLLHLHQPQDGHGDVSLRHHNHAINTRLGTRKCIASNLKRSIYSEWFTIATEPSLVR